LLVRSFLRFDLERSCCLLLHQILLCFRIQRGTCCRLCLCGELFGGLLLALLIILFDVPYRSLSLDGCL
jgi:hypothetical protein